MAALRLAAMSLVADCIMEAQALSNSRTKTMIAVLDLFCFTLRMDQLSGMAGSRSGNYKLIRDRLLYRSVFLQHMQIKKNREFLKTRFPNQPV
jgi:hypothetical protein